jgi:hypothetical protein
VAGALGGNHADGHELRSLDQVEVNVEAVAEEQRVAVLQVGLDLLGEDLGLSGIGCEHHDHVGPLGHLCGSSDLQALLLRLGAGLRACRQADANIDAGVAQAERVRVALASVADHSDLAALDDRQISIVVVEHLDCHWLLPFLLGFTHVRHRGR